MSQDYYEKYDDLERRDYKKRDDEYQLKRVEDELREVRWVADGTRSSSGTSSSTGRYDDFDRMLEQKFKCLTLVAECSGLRNKDWIRSRLNDIPLSESSAETEFKELLKTIAVQDPALLDAARVNSQFISQICESPLTPQAQREREALSVQIGQICASLNSIMRYHRRYEAANRSRD